MTEEEIRMLVADYLQGYGATTRLTYDASGKKANLFATLGDSAKRGLVLSGHSDVAFTPSGESLSGMTDSRPRSLPPRSPKNHSRCHKVST